MHCSLKLHADDAAAPMCATLERSRTLVQHAVIIIAPPTVSLGRKGKAR